MARQRQIRNPHPAAARWLEVRGLLQPNRGVEMNRDDARDIEIQALRGRLSRLSEASLRINESLDFDTVLQGVLDSARDLTMSRYGVFILPDDAGGMREFFGSGMTPEQGRKLWADPDRVRFFDYVGSNQKPLRLRDFHSHARALGLPEFPPAMTASSLLSFLAAPIRHQGEHLGTIYLDEKEGEYTQEDEETLVLFASQAAMVIANARRYREEQRGQGAPGDADRHLSGGCGGLRRPNGSAGVVQPGGGANRREPARPRPILGAVAGGSVLSAGRRTEDFSVRHS